MLGIFVGGNVCNAAEMKNSIEVQVKSEVINYDETAALIENPSEATYHPNCILSENTNEDNQSDISFIKLSPSPTVAFCKRSISNDLVERCKLKIDGLLKGNMPPIYSVSRTILFHSLQINF
ncbi:hypothetical protein [Gelidibacter sp.]|uniref:hypothetical protein n=1 Tax=Gelidibacter sp. TaxID=2018083 RepID=UPI0032633500